jgi:hypothetical protein|tara:strand:- start:1835 stop:2449 length:615 start_codon:yes stop_codon:yes gene_type:complete
MSLLKTIFQLNKLQKLLIKKERIDVETNNIKQELLQSDLVNLLASILKESTSEQCSTSVSDADLQPSSIVDVINDEVQVNSEPTATDTLSSMNESSIAAGQDTTETLSPNLADEVITSNTCDVSHVSDEVKSTDKVRQKLLVTIQSFDEENNLVFLQAEDRMFDFPYIPEDHVGVSEGDTCELIIYEDDTYLFNKLNLQEVKAA